MRYHERNCGTLCDDFSKITLQMDMDMHSEQFKCDKCSKCFSTKSGLQWHTHMHGGTSSILCSHCSLNFSLKDNLKRHVSNQYDK